jgi:hypothetical protein
MPAFIITFEVNDAARLSSLKEKAKSLGGYCPIHNNAVAISTEKTAVEIREYLTPLLTPSDRIFVIRSGTEAAWRNSYGTEHNEWLKKYL